MAGSKFNSLWGQKRVQSNQLSNNKGRVIHLKRLSDRLKEGSKVGLKIRNLILRRIKSNTITSMGF
jgi:hypothetical protein